MIHVTIRTLDSQNTDFDLDDQITVAAFKEIIYKKLNILPAQQRLIFKGKVLQDEKLLNFYNPHDQVLHLVERPPNRTQTDPSPTIPTSTVSNSSQVYLGSVDVPLDVNFDFQFENALNQLAQSFSNHTQSVQSNDQLLNSSNISFSKPRLENVQKMLKDAKKDLDELENLNNSNQPTTSTDFNKPNETTSNILDQTFESRPKTDVLANVLEEYGKIVGEFQKHLSTVVNSLREGNQNMTQDQVENSQTRFNRCSRILHYLSHAEHSLSDLVVDFHETDPRYIRAAILHQEIFPIEVTTPYPPSSTRQTPFSGVNASNTNTWAINPAPYVGNSLAVQTPNINTSINTGVGSFNQQQPYNLWANNVQVSDGWPIILNSQTNVPPISSNAPSVQANDTSTVNDSSNVRGEQVESSKAVYNSNESMLDGVSTNSTTASTSKRSVSLNRPPRTAENQLGTSTTVSPGSSYTLNRSHVFHVNIDMPQGVPAPRSHQFMLPTQATRNARNQSTAPNNTINSNLYHLPPIMSSSGQQRANVPPLNLFMTYNDPLLPCVSHHFLDTGDNSTIDTVNVAIQPIGAAVRRVPVNRTSRSVSQGRRAPGQYVFVPMMAPTGSHSIHINSGPGITYAAQGASHPIQHTAPIPPSSNADVGVNYIEPTPPPPTNQFNRVVNQNLSQTVTDTFNQLSNFMPPGFSMPPGIQNIISNFAQQLNPTLATAFQPAQPISSLSSATSPIQTSTPTTTVNSSSGTSFQSGFFEIPVSSGLLSGSGGNANIFNNLLNVFFPPPASTSTPSTQSSTATASVTIPSTSVSSPVNRPGPTPDAMNFLGALTGQFLFNQQPNTSTFEPGSNAAATHTTPSSNIPSAPGSSIFDFLSQFNTLFPDMNAGTSNMSDLTMNTFDNDIFSRMITYVFRNTDFSTIQAAFAQNPQGLNHIIRLIRRFIRNECLSNSSCWANSTQTQRTQHNTIPTPDINPTETIETSVSLEEQPTKEKLAAFVEGIITEMRLTTNPLLYSYDTRINVDIGESISKFLRAFIVNLLADIYNANSSTPPNIVASIYHGVRELNLLLCSILINPERDLPMILRDVLVDAVNSSVPDPLGGEFLANLVYDWIRGQFLNTQAIDPNTSTDVDIQFIGYFHEERVANDDTVFSQVQPCNIPLQDHICTTPSSSSELPMNRLSNQSTDSSEDYQSIKSGELHATLPPTYAANTDKRKVEMDDLDDENLASSKKSYEQNKKKNLDKQVKEANTEGDWRDALPSEWVSVIEMDVEKMVDSNHVPSSQSSRDEGDQMPGFRFSDAYVSGMGEQKQKVMESLQDTPLTTPMPEMYLHELLLKACKEAQVETDPSEINNMAGSIFHDRDLYNGFVEMMSQDINRIVVNDTDYDPQRFPDIAKFLKNLQHKKD